MGSSLGISEEKILALQEYASSPLYSSSEKTALLYADCMTLTDRDVDDSLFEQLLSFFSEEEIVELTALIAWENASSKFNRALRISSQNLWRASRSGE